MYVYSVLTEYSPDGRRESSCQSRDGGEFELSGPIGLRQVLNFIFS